MKKIYTLLFMLVISLTGFAQQLLFEPFNYTPDPTNGLAAQSNGVWSRVNTGDSILVTSGNLSYTGLPASMGNKVNFDGTGADYHTSFASQTTGSVYYSFILNVPSLGGLNTSGSYFINLLQTGSTSIFGAAVWARASATTGKYNLGISTRSNSTVSWIATDLDPGTSYFVVANYQMITGTANDIAEIWLNTTAIGGTEPAATATAATGSDMSSVGGILLRQASATTTPFVDIDEIRVGTDWASVTPGSVPVASLSATSLQGFGNICLNMVSVPDSFTITGSNLTNANVTVSAPVDYLISTALGGPFSQNLSIPQSGGSFTQKIYVMLLPTAVQSYNGNIVVGGGGASSINVAVTGAGVNTAPTVTTGSASSITTNSADLAGTINDPGCTAVTAYGVEYSTTAGFANGTGTQVPSTNLSGTAFSSAVGGLAPATTYYYKAYATNSGGTTYGNEQSFTTLSLAPTITVTSLAGFGNVCVNTTSTVTNTFTINGSNLTNANVTVGPLAGFEFATLAGGPFSNTLSLTQPGGNFSQQVYVRFNPTVVQSYNGDIPVAGGGVAAPVNVAVTGAGVDSAPGVTTGAASAITMTSATLNGVVADAGCSAITAYGFEYSTTNNFPTGSGTQVAASNLSGGNFSVPVTSLTASTVYYYRAFATNSGGTSYGTQQSFTTSAPPPATLNATALAAFGNVCAGTGAGPNSFTLTGSNLTSASVTIGALPGYTYSTTATGNFTSTLTLTPSGGNLNQVVYVWFNPTAAQSYNGNIPVSGGGAAAITVASSGTGINTPATITTGNATSVTTHSAILSGNLSDLGCSFVSDHGIEYSGIDNFTPGNGTRSSLGATTSTGAFSVQLNNLVQGATYYYRAYARNNSGVAYGEQQSFTVVALANDFVLYPVPVRAGNELRFSRTNMKQGYAGIQIFNIAGQEVFRKHFNIQNNFINQTITIPSGLPTGIYSVRISNDTEILDTEQIIILN